MLDGTTENATAKSNCAGAIANGFLEGMNDGSLVQNVVAVGCRVVGILDDLVTLGVHDVKFIQGVAMHGTGHKANVVGMFRFYKDNSKFSHNQF